MFEAGIGAMGLIFENLKTMATDGSKQIVNVLWGKYTLKSQIIYLVIINI